ncbi:hypothetical protein CLAFUW4_09501 [Fulvia fulva]|uniref:Uncharacterized protein n=1 Tax=Passalora fulva TaxID=5499 RepID=A0A9Q8PFS4_PASFU|nr:uncharacterized protein CLAFUR5_09598 [Fulvia fulva]KAK4613281.1 hypothetical protein CLAFUR4_09507 [Fulvia fulva]KAK4614887.1 hypothetical protein CLAFUR0_09498 [Fulvia fulva]UJO21673.1 hypothetical protein CLAFUR5_09598 [Fulvia fulva]WPV20362.1 hypothetical protein CLAFUW4_09501 [Fulvia fulva]WPV34866.1 hypothetical protein CLAFUW7_09502 [Fulvia fulva]
MLFNVDPPDHHQSITPDMAKRSREESIDEQAAMRTPKKIKKNPQASLLGLPGELRNRIYRYALLEEDFFVYSGAANWGNLKKWMQQVHLGHLKREPYGLLDHSGCPNIHVVEMATGIVMKARALPWDEVEPILDIFKQGISIGNSGFWEDDE